MVVCSLRYRRAYCADMQNEMGTYQRGYPWVLFGILCSLDTCNKFHHFLMQLCDMVKVEIFRRRYALCADLEYTVKDYFLILSVIDVWSTL